MINYKNYKWFYTSSGKLVVGGKNAEQNDSLLSLIKEDYIIMHTSSPGSPFSIILSDISNIEKSDLKETAIFTACFSQQWKKSPKEIEVHIFRASQISKSKSMKTGTWGVIGKIEKIKVKPKLYLSTQEGVLRAVPFKSSEKSISIVPGKKDKSLLVEEIQSKLKTKIPVNEILAALPAGGIEIR